MATVIHFDDEQVNDFYAHSLLRHDMLLPDSIDPMPTPDKSISFEASILKQIANSSRAITAKEIKAMINKAFIRFDEGTITISDSIYNDIDDMIIKATFDE